MAIDARRPFVLAARTRRKLRGTAMTLLRDEASTSIERVVKASSSATRNEIEQTSLDVDELDLLIDPADYKVDGTAVEPAEGDRFRETVGKTTREYVVAPRDGDPGWRWSDEHFIEYRVHARIDSETPA